MQFPHDFYRHLWMTTRSFCNLLNTSLAQQLAPWAFVVAESVTAELDSVDWQLGEG